MSLNDNHSVDSDSNSSSDSCNLNDLDEWQERNAQQNHEIDRMIEDMVLSNLNITGRDSIPRARRRHCERERELGEERLMNDYFVDSPTYTPELFRRRFRMRKSVFLRIVNEVTTNDEYFQQTPDATGRLSLSPLQKCTGVMRVLAYGTSTDAVDEYLRMSAAVTRKSLKHFVEGVISCFGEEYLRKPNEQDLARLLYVGEQRGFPGMIGSIDCMHWNGKIVLLHGLGNMQGEVENQQSFWKLLHHMTCGYGMLFFGNPGTCNDINVLQRSPIFTDVLEGRAPKVSYVVNGREHKQTYYLTDGIYPSWAVFVKSIPSPVTQKHKLYAQHQEAVQKDVERTFGVLQARFAFLKPPCLVWDKLMMGKIMMACIIMHNMIVEDERDTYLNYYDPTEFLVDSPVDDDQSFCTECIASLSTYMTNREQLRNRDAHAALKNDLIEHIWQKFGNDY